MTDKTITITDKIVTHNTEPFVATLDNCLTQEECEHMIRISKPAMKKSLVSFDKIGVESSGRTSQNAWIQHDHDEITKRIGEKIAKIVGMPLENAEAFQVIYYDTSAEYRNHYDSWEHDGSEKTLRCMKNGGARLKTALVYLNDVEKGGSTRLNRLNIDVLPNIGKLLLFENTYTGTNVRHPQSEHAGMPVIKGEKYAFNLWFKECRAKKLYSEFNPGYYNSISITTTNTIIPTINTSETIYDVKTNKRSTIINEKYKLEEGDYFPFINLQFHSGQSKQIHNFVDDKEFMIIVLKNIEQITHFNSDSRYNTIILYKEGTPTDNIKSICCNTPLIYNLFEDCNENIHMYLLTPNRKIYKKYELESLDEFNKKILEKNKYSNYNVPYLLIENVLSEELLSKIQKYYDSNNTKRQTHNTSSKNRHHIHPDKQLEIDLDNKLSRSLFPEIKKIFNFDVNYRELYKICSYDAETDGRFHAHRDTPSPFQHRRYAMSLFLNDDYEGGEFELPEYNFKIKPKANCALIFPGICSHKVNQVTNGSRRVIITFFCSEIEGKTKDNPTYAVKSNFFKENNVVYSEIYPE
jgi:prolyl 4-hydroxylase